MPIKRRTDKGRHLDEYRREMLKDGPEAMLLAGLWPPDKRQNRHNPTEPPARDRSSLAGFVIFTPWPAAPG